MDVDEAADTERIPIRDVLGGSEGDLVDDSATGAFTSDEAFGEISRGKPGLKLGRILGLEEGLGVQPREGKKSIIERGREGVFRGKAIGGRQANTMGVFDEI